MKNLEQFLGRENFFQTIASEQIQIKGPNYVIFESIGLYRFYYCSLTVRLNIQLLHLLTAKR